MISEPHLLPARRKLKNHCNEISTALERVVSADKPFGPAMNTSGVKRKRGDKKSKSKRQRTESLNKRCKRRKNSAEGISCSPEIPENENLRPNKVSIGTSVDVDLLGPCEPGSDIVLEGIVWTETTRGVLVINVTWRGRTYVGTLIDSTTTPRDLLGYRRDQRSLKGDLPLSSVGERILRSGKRRTAVSFVNDHIPTESVFVCNTSLETVGTPAIEDNGVKEICDNIKTESIDNAPKEDEVDAQNLAAPVSNKCAKVCDAQENNADFTSIIKTNIEYAQLPCNTEYVKSEIELSKSSSPIKKLESMTSTKLNELQSHNLLQKKSYEIVPYNTDSQVMNGSYINVSSNFSTYPKGSPIDMLTHVVEESTVPLNSSYKAKTPKEKCKSLNRCEKKRDERNFKKTMDCFKQTEIKNTRDNLAPSCSNQRSRNVSRNEHSTRTKTPDVNDWTMQIQSLNQGYVPDDESESVVTERKEHNSVSLSSKEAKSAPPKIQGSKYNDNMINKPSKLPEISSRKNSKSVDNKEHFKKNNLKTTDSKEPPLIRTEAESFRWRFPAPMPLTTGSHNEDFFASDPHFNHARNYSNHRAQVQHPYEFTFNPFIIYPNIPRLPLNSFFDPLVKNFYPNYGCLPATTRPSHL